MFRLFYVTIVVCEIYNDFDTIEAKLHLTNWEKLRT